MNFRYSRQTAIPIFGEQGQHKLGKSSVLVIGAGGLGSPVLLYLAAAGIGKITIVENDRVDETNLQRQVLYTEKDIGNSKIDLTVKKLKEMNGAIEIVAHKGRFTSQNSIKIAKGHDLIIDCSDNFPTRYLASDVAEILNIPLVYGALYRFEGQVSVFNYEGGPTYRDLFPEPPTAQMAPDCSTAGVLGSVAGIVGTLMATEAIKILSKVGKPLSGQLLVVDTLHMDMRKIKIFRNPSRAVITQLIDYDLFCSSKGDVNQLSWSEYLELKNEFLQLIDVRTPAEYFTRNLQGLNIPMDQLLERSNEIQKEGKVLVYCQSGGRSQRAIETLKSLGYSNLYNLVGGINAVPEGNLAK